MDSDIQCATLRLCNADVKRHHAGSNLYAGKCRHSNLAPLCSARPPSLLSDVLCFITTHVQVTTMPYSLRSRTHSPLAELPLDRYIPAKRASTSPTPRGSKRHQPYASTSASASVASSSKDRHGLGEDGEWTRSPVKKRTRTVTPRVKQVLDRDDLGVGKSPARRLFATCIAESSSSHSSL